MSEEGARLRNKLNRNVQYFKDGIIEAGFKIHQVNFAGCTASLSIIILFPMIDSEQSYCSSHNW